jgi:hypothetical protein
LRVSRLSGGTRGSKRRIWRRGSKTRRRSWLSLKKNLRGSLLRKQSKSERLIVGEKRKRRPRKRKGKCQLSKNG